MAFKDGSAIGTLIGVAVWSIFRTVEWIGNFNTWFSIYPMQTFVTMVFAFGVVGGIILWDEMEDKDEN